MNQFDVAGVLFTYSIRCTTAETREHLKEILNELNNKLFKDELENINIDNNSSEK